MFKKKLLCVHPNSPLNNFGAILADINKLPINQNAELESLAANYHHNTDHYTLEVTSQVLQKGSDNGPVLILIPWFGGKSASLKKFLGLQQPTWTMLNLDPFKTRGNLAKISDTAEGAQHAYALVISLLARQIQKAHQQGRKVGLVGFSYGANIIGAYLSRGLEIPDAMVAIEGGDIVQTVLHAKYGRYEYDPGMLAALAKNHELIPTQTPTKGIAADRSLAIINKGDKVVLCQDQIWQKAKTKLYINGRHTLAPLLNRGKIRKLAHAHLQALLA